MRASCRRRALLSTVCAVAAMLAVGAPLSAAMAFWLSSPLMDPAMFAITAGELGAGVGMAKANSAILVGEGGGFAVLDF